MRYQIYHYVPEGIYTPAATPPYGIDFTTGLSVRLHPVRTLVLGELIECVHYAAFDAMTQTPTTPIVKENWEYFRDATGYATHRIHTIAWYFEDGTLDEVNTKVRTKYYMSLQERREEAYRRKKNQTSAACETVIGALMQSGYTYEQAVGEGFGYWQSLVNEVSLFENGNDHPLLDRLNNDTTPAWVPAVSPYVLAELA